VLVIDGHSTDRTHQLVEEIARTVDVAVRLVENPKQIVSPGLNLGIASALGEVIVRMDGHSEAAPDYVSQCVATLQVTGADNVGGVVEYVGENSFSQAAGVGSQSRFGSGGAPARTGRAGPVDTVSFGCWRREAFDRFGLFDETFVRTQDSEFNYRTRLLGGRIWLNPRIRSRYFSRSSVRGLARQHFQYGFWKTRLMRKLHGHLQWRHFVPPLLVAALLASALAILGGAVVAAPVADWLLAGGLLVPSVYAVAVLAASVNTALRNRSPGLFPLLLIIFPILHVSWGVGFLWGLIKRPDPAELQPLPERNGGSELGARSAAAEDPGIAAENAKDA